MSDTFANPAGVANAVVAAYQVFTPPPKLTVSEWADRYRHLSSIDSPEPGKWHTSRAPYLKGMMDAFSDPAIEGVVVMASAQVGKTSCLNNVVGFFIHQDPAPIMVVNPTKDDAEEWSKDRFMRAMVEVTPVLRALVSAERKKGSNQTIVHKEFPGGQLTAAWSNSKSRLSSRPIRVCLMDEIDKYDTDPGPQGDPVARALNRTKRFWNRKWGEWSTPTLKGLSRIERDYQDISDRRRFQIPCPECSTKGVLGFFPDSAGVKPDSGFHIAWPKGKPDEAYAVCHACGAIVPDRQRQHMVELGEWVAERPGGNIAGFHINELYSSLGTASWPNIACKFIKARGNILDLQNFYNETLGETWEIQGETIASTALFLRREQYAAEVPGGACVLSCGVDIQRDRIEASIWGFGAGREAWLIEHRQILGDPALDSIWRELDGLLTRSYEHESGVPLHIIQTFVDAADGQTAQYVYSYCKSRIGMHVYPCHGRANPPGNALPIVDRPHKLASGIQLYNIGVDTAKSQLYAYLRIEKPGLGYVHLPAKAFCDDEYCKQLTSEKLVLTRKEFRPRLEWKKTRDRNEALDTAVYALAAMESRRVDFSAASEHLQKRAAQLAQVPEPEQVIVGDLPQPKAPPPNRVVRRNNWANHW